MNNTWPPKLEPITEKIEQTPVQVRLGDVLHAEATLITGAGVVMAARAAENLTSNFFRTHPHVEAIRHAGLSAAGAKPEPLVEPVLPPQPTILDSEPVLQGAYVDSLMAEEKSMGLDAALTTSDTSQTINDDNTVQDNDTQARIDQFLQAAQASSTAISESNARIYRMVD